MNDAFSLGARTGLYGPLRPDMSFGGQSRTTPIMMKTFARVAILAGAMALSAASVASAQDRSLTINNRTSHTMTEIHSTPHSQSDWGPDLLEGTIEAGGSGSGTLDGGTDGACNFDFQAKFDDGTDATVMNVNVCQVSTINVTE